MDYKTIIKQYWNTLDRTRPTYENRSDLPRAPYDNRTDLPRADVMIPSKVPMISDERMRSAIEQGKASLNRRKETPPLERMAIFGR